MIYRMNAENFTGIGMSGNYYDTRRHYWFIIWGLWMKMKIRYPEIHYTFKSKIYNGASKQECKDFFLGLFNYYNQAENCDLQLIASLAVRLRLSEVEKDTILSLNGLLDNMPIPSYTNIKIPVLPNGYNKEQKISLLVDASLISLTSQSVQEMKGMDNYLYFCAKGLNVTENEKLNIFNAVRKNYNSVNPYCDYSNFTYSVKHLI